MIQLEDVAALRAVENGDYYGHCCHEYDKHGGSRQTALAAAFTAGGIAIAGLIGIGVYANARSKAAEAKAEAYALRHSDLQALVMQQANNLNNEILARQNGDALERSYSTNATNRVADKIDIVNSTATSANSSATSWANAEATLATGVLTQQYRQCPQEVTMVSKQYCPCPASNCGCGCNG